MGVAFGKREGLTEAERAGLHRKSTEHRLGEAQHGILFDFHYSILCVFKYIMEL